MQDWDFYMVFSMFRIAAILQGIAKRALEGTAANADASDVGRLARPRPTSHDEGMHNARPDGEPDEAAMDAR